MSITDFTPKIFTNGKGEPISSQNLNIIFDTTNKINNNLGKEAKIKDLQDKIAYLQDALNTKTIFNVYEFTPLNGEVVSFNVNDYSDGDIVFISPPPPSQVGMYVPKIGAYPFGSLSPDGEFKWGTSIFYGYQYQLIHCKPNVINEI